MQKNGVKYIINVVGPRYSDMVSADKNEQCVQLIRKVILDSLCEADRYNCESIAFPAVSSGKLVSCDTVRLNRFLLL